MMPRGGPLSGTKWLRCPGRNANCYTVLTMRSQRSTYYVATPRHDFNNRCLNNIFTVSLQINLREVSLMSAWETLLSGPGMRRGGAVTVPRPPGRVMLWTQVWGDLGPGRQASHAPTWASLTCPVRWRGFSKSPPSWGPRGLSPETRVRVRVSHPPPPTVLSRETGAPHDLGFSPTRQRAGPVCTRQVLSTQQVLSKRWWEGQPDPTAQRLLQETWSPFQDKEV